MLNIISVRYGVDNVYSSRDKWLYFEVDDYTFNSMATAEEIIDIHKIDGKLVRCSNTTNVTSDYSSDIKKTDKDTQAYLESMYKKHCAETTAQEQNARKDKGYINYTKNYGDVKPEDYYGLLKKYFTPHALDYINSGVVFGYLGHENRTKETDQVICDFLEENPDSKSTVNDMFLTHSSGRHFMDNYNSPEQLRKYLEEL